MRDLLALAGPPGAAEPSVLQCFGDAAFAHRRAVPLAGTFLRNDIPDHYTTQSRVLILRQFEPINPTLDEFPLNLGLSKPHFGSSTMQLLDVMPLLLP